MLSIGEFSKICKVSTKTLRYYDEIGLIPPEDINPENGYRYYSIRQLKKMLLINRLKSYQFSLEEIKNILDLEEDLAEEKLGSALHRKRKEVQEKINAYEYTLTQLNLDILRAEKGKPMMSWLDDIEVVLAEAQPITILYVRKMMSSHDYALGYEKYFSRLYEKIAVDKLTLLGTPMTIYHSPEYNPAGNDTEFAIPIEESVKGTRNLPGGLCAKSVLKGPYAELTSVYAKLREWVEDEGYELTQSPYEVYVTDHLHAAIPVDIVTEVYFPIKKKER
ncbi:MerR family transcriptional regulator [Bacillus mojavensis]|uniref:MerR family transcriptional regulator n=1 Tax=Bacillus mojavensis TaxID=72360 RepID=UPI002DBF935D|nr:MerR family transcriptional regulator [Bacillus mojavensis]MEC1614146.1 MerR family transcriptional regulator [Bacillus mojavensis]MEC1622262.1 MerR family transcriptional regulator [Bacillus mojavensis]MEC1660805.1 MerR family transcriptional regulator [Bacillus mojavensis]MEC1685463.1 MerR family transcriptional regulator [Bacillus mojavensis]MEC1692110.1 MerR family transcriptional regulator [Bacillus mojavensis]